MNQTGQSLPVNSAARLGGMNRSRSPAPGMRSQTLDYPSTHDVANNPSPNVSRLPPIRTGSLATPHQHYQPQQQQQQQYYQQQAQQYVQSSPVPSSSNSAGPPQKPFVSGTGGAGARGRNDSIDSYYGLGSAGSGGVVNEVRNGGGSGWGSGGDIRQGGGANVNGNGNGGGEGNSLGRSESDGRAARHRNVTGEGAGTWGPGGDDQSRSKRLGVHTNHSTPTLHLNGGKPTEPPPPVPNLDDIDVSNLSLHDDRDFRAPSRAAGGNWDPRMPPPGPGGGPDPYGSQGSSSRNPGGALDKSRSSSASGSTELGYAGRRDSGKSDMVDTRGKGRMGFDDRPESGEGGSSFGPPDGQGGGGGGRYPNEPAPSVYGDGSHEDSFYQGQGGGAYSQAGGYGGGPPSDYGHGGGVAAYQQQQAYYHAQQQQQQQQQQPHLFAYAPPGPEGYPYDPNAHLHPNMAQQGYYPPNPYQAQAYYAQQYAQNPYFAGGGNAMGYAPPEGSAYGGSGGSAYGPAGLARTMSSASSFVSSNVPASVTGRSEGSVIMPTTSIRKATSTTPERVITKAYIDEYRNRIKNDPDPEAHFNFAKFLIEAARKFGQSGGDDSNQKALKKYRDSLLQEALKLIKKLATSGTGSSKTAYADAQFFLATCLGLGALGLQPDHEKAYNLYVQASKQNHPAATYRTAVCNERGQGTRRDYGRAVLFYQKASVLADTAGMYKLGMILFNGLLGQQRQPKEAIIWLKRAAAQADEENPHALHELGLLCENPPKDVPGARNVITECRDPDPKAQEIAALNAAREFFTQAAQLGYPPSQFKLGACYEFGSLLCPIDPKRSIAWYTRAAEKNLDVAELALSGWYLTGADGVLKQSDNEAYLWARRAANKGLSKAEYAVGYYSEVGIGTKQDVEEAKRWYMRAAAQGNKRAMVRLTELKQQGAQRNNKKVARPTRQQAKDECIIV